ncbi:hypothetical protein GIB67_011386 [Kingdonia uniflora]|uniref:Retrotransposon gag domain-containing protein n=1 Tax=Kingdonia uniflora TaxID=39325 RepID=A0A7J7M3P2_9MAGN|nr:hypothetical protein GIB67_011386 [Kingdonia uniflora]
MLVETKLTEYALNWLESLQKGRRNRGLANITEWHLMKQEKMKCFVQANYEEESFTRLQNLRQHLSSMDTYTNEFYLLSSWVSTTELEAQKISRFKSELSKKIQDVLTMLNIPTVVDAVELANRAEAKFQMNPIVAAIPTTTTTPTIVRLSGGGNGVQCFGCGKTDDMRRKCPNNKNTAEMVLAEFSPYLTNELFNNGFTMPPKNKKAQQEVTGDPSQDTPKHVCGLGYAGIKEKLPDAVSRILVFYALVCYFGLSCFLKVYKLC